MIHRFFTLLLPVVFCVLAACAPPTESSVPPSVPPSSEADIPSQDTTYTFTDALGNRITVDRPQRVVSFYGSFAEMWVLAGGSLVGTTDDAITERGLSLGENVSIIGGTKTPNLELTLNLAPDLVLLSADTTDHLQAAGTLQSAGIPCAFFRVDTLEDYLHAMEICTGITGRVDLYEENALSVQAQAQAVMEKVRLAAETEPPTILLLRFKISL